MTGLLTDFYELTMAQGYHLSGENPRVVFDLFFRREPFGGGYAVFAGLEHALAHAAGLSFTADDIAWLASLGSFRDDFLDRLARLRFTGDVWAMDEGTVVFPGEPLLRVHAPLIEAQLLESALLNIVNFQTLVATKAARVRHAARGGSIIEFGLRRAQGPDGAISAARAAFVGGVEATSNAEAGRRFAIPVRGTMAHSWVMAFPDELAAFRGWARAWPDNCLLLIDTYDTLASGLPNAVAVGQELARAGHAGFGVRIDSGDLEYLSKKVRQGLDAAGLRSARIVVSNELDEHIIEQLVTRGAPIDAWGVGTNLVTGSGDPALTGVYKLCARGGPPRGGGASAAAALQPVLKVSNNPEKVTNPGVKQVWRFHARDGSPLADLVALDGERIQAGTSVTFRHPTGDWRSFTLGAEAAPRPLLSRKLGSGRLIEPPPPLASVRDRAAAELAALDDTYKRLINPHRYRVSLSERLADLKARLIAEARAKGEQR